MANNACAICNNKLPFMTGYKMADGNKICQNCKNDFGAKKIDDITLIKKYGTVELLNSCKNFEEFKVQINKIFCPQCHSTNFTVLGQEKSNATMGFAVGRTIMASSTNNSDYKAVCSDCGTRFEIKNKL